MEIATEENEEIVSKLYEGVIGEIGKPGRPPDTAELALVYEVEHFQQEIGSGASFEQYFRWADKTEIDGIIEKLEQLGLVQLADTTKEAITVAFPNGVPEDPEQFDELTEWTDAQEERLSYLYSEISSLHGAITNRLGEYAKEKGLVE